MEELMSAISSKYFSGVIVGFFLFFVFGGLIGKWGYRGSKKDGEVANDAEPLTDNKTRWGIQWIREDVSIIMGVLLTISGLLGAILFVLLLK